MSGGRYAAVFFDMDGTLVESEDIWHQVEHDVLHEWDVPQADIDATDMTGWSMEATAAHMQSLGVRLEQRELIAELDRRVGLAMGDGVPLHRITNDLLQRCIKRGIPRALVTMTYRELADSILAGLPAGSFDVTVTGDEVTRGKPDPEPYLKAAAELGVDPASCLVVEDSRTGVAAGLAAGCTVRMVGPLAGTIENAPALTQDDIDGI